MRKLWKKGAALVLAAVMCASALGGCSKKAEAKPVYTFNGEKVDADLTNFLLRYEQAGIDQSYGSMFSSYYGQSMWTLDLSGTGEVYETTYKTEFGESFERLLLAEEHAADYSVELTDDEKAAITEAATKFMTDNDKEALASMSATQEVVERALTLYTVQSRVENEIAKDVDTNVSDEEAAQTTVSYIEYTPTTEAQGEEETETEASMTEAEVSMTEGETSPQTEAETAAVETEEADKTASADETEAAAETEAAVTAAETEAESETEDPALTEAKEKYRAMAEETLAKIQSGATDFETASADADAQGEEGVTTGSFTYGSDDTYPAAEIMDAASALADGEVADQVVESGDVYYILHMDAVFDKEATESKKEEIVDERRHELIDSVYDGWIEKESWEIDAEALALISLADRTYAAPESADTEAAEDLVVETEEVSTEAEMIVETEADAVQTEADITAATEAE